jgi:hypothetical protein
MEEVNRTLYRMDTDRDTVSVSKRKRQLAKDKSDKELKEMTWVTPQM